MQVKLHFSSFNSVGFKKKKSKTGEDQQMWLLVTHRNMIVSSMLLLAHTHARIHTLMPQDPSTPHV